jgi:NitT/TauT family transport system ATP-binding protein
MPAARGSELKLLLHAPTPAALARARSNAVNALRDRLGAEVVIMINSGAVAAALDAPEPVTDQLLVYCENTLRRLGRHAPPGARTVPAVVLALADWQAEGWTYVRA